MLSWQLLANNMELKHKTLDFQLSVPDTVLLLPAFLIHIDHSGR